MDTNNTSRTQTVMYDADGNETDDASRAVRGEIVEFDETGAVVRRYPDLIWRVDPRALEGDAGEAATRPESKGAE